MKSVSRRLFACSSLLALALFTSCTIDSADEFSRDVSVNFSGFYQNKTAGKIVSNNSGNSITSLDLRQTGDSLEAVDNNGRIWRGNLGEVQNDTSSFELNGQTTAGRDGTFSGTLSTSDSGSTGSVSNAKGTMQGTYIESDRFGTFSATATIPGTVDNGGGGVNTNTSTNVVSALTLDQTTVTLSTNGLSRVFTASGGTAPYKFSLANTTRGKITEISGTNQEKATYERLTSGNNTITVKDTSGKSFNATILQP